MRLKNSLNVYFWTSDRVTFSLYNYVTKSAVFTKGHCLGELRSILRYAQIALHFKSTKIVDLLSIKTYHVFQFSERREVEQLIKRGWFVKLSLVYVSKYLCPSRSIEPQNRTEVLGNNRHYHSFGKQFPKPKTVKNTGTLISFLYLEPCEHQNSS